MTEVAPTPRRWRAAALAVLVGGFLAGERATAHRRTGAAIVAAALGTLVGALRVSRASRRPPIDPSPPRPAGAPPGSSRPTFTILVAARDEAGVLPQLVRDVAAQDHRDAAGEPCFDLVVIDDRSVDGTGDAALMAARAAGIGPLTRVAVRAGDRLPDGKGAALTAVQPADCRGEIVVVLDADARIAPGFLTALAGYVRAGAPAVTARRRILHAGSSTLAQVQADEQTLDGELQRGRWSLGGCSEFRGNGIVVSRELLEAVGGWRAEALTEDLDLSSRVAARAGVGVAWAIDAEVWEEPVHTWSSLWRQRIRWAEGAVRRLFDHGPSVVASARLPVPARIDFAVYAGQLLAPPLVLGASFGAIRRGRPSTAIALVAVYAAVGGLLGWDALRWEQDGDGRPPAPAERLRRAARLALFNGIWLAAVPAALWRLATRRGPVHYDKMEHGLV